jgi:hypothetical protein
VNCLPGFVYFIHYLSTGVLGRKKETIVPPQAERGLTIRRLTELAG